jgi:Holliday junction resolvasome RuvABC endonuclease subunit
MQKILSLDLGTKMGWAVNYPVICSGMFNLSPDRNRKFEGGGMRFLRMAEWLEKMPKPDIIVFETVRRHISTDSAHAYGGYLATLTAWCEANNVPYEGVPVQTIKIFITGKGNAKKDAVIAAIQAKGFVDVTDDNQADALALLLMRINEHH